MPVLSLIARIVAQLIVRNLDPDIVARLRRRAAEHGRSMEAEHRDILRDALQHRRGRTSFKQHLLEMPDVGSDTIGQIFSRWILRVTDWKAEVSLALPALARPRLPRRVFRLSQTMNIEIPR